jgi:hypothetical protein
MPLGSGVNVLTPDPFELAASPRPTAGMEEAPRSGWRAMRTPEKHLMVRVTFSSPDGYTWSRACVPAADRQDGGSTPERVESNENAGEASYGSRHL